MSYVAFFVLLKHLFILRLSFQLKIHRFIRLYKELTRVRVASFATSERIFLFRWLRPPLKTALVSWAPSIDIIIIIIIIIIIRKPCMKHGSEKIHRGYCTVSRRYEFYFRVAKQYFTSERSECVKYCFRHLKIKFISSSHRVMFFLLHRQKDIDKIIDFYSPKSNCDGSDLQYSNIRHWLKNNTELNRALQWRNISKTLKNV